MHTRFPMVVCAAVAMLAALAPAAQATNFGPDAVPGVTRPAILVGNNWDGTTDIVDPDTFERLDRIDVIPDRAEREADFAFDPVKQGFYLAIRELIGEGNHQYNDDVFSSHDGRTIFVSRPSFADVVAIDLASKKIKWRAPVDGYRSDHMAISSDGKRLYVSASTGNVVHELDTETGTRTGGFVSGDSPHENIISKDGKLIYHASIGRVYLPVDQPPIAAPARGGEFFQVVERATGKILKRIVMSEKMAEAGFENFSAAVRPMALTADEKTLYFQLSFHHGFVEYDLETDTVKRVATLPISEEAAALTREQYLLDSAHHGLAIDSKGEKLCAAGTMSDYGAIVSRKTFQARVLDIGKKPYWATNSIDGRHCYMSASQSDHVAVISYDAEQVVHKFPVGRHPQRVRNGVVAISQYAQGKHGERFKLALTVPRRPISINRGARFGCRAAGAQKLTLSRCSISVRRGRKLVGAAEKVIAGRRAFSLQVKLTPLGRKLVARSGRRGLSVKVSARGVDSVGRRATAVRTARLRARR